MKRVSLFLSEPQVVTLQDLSKRLGRPTAELIRQAIDEFLRSRNELAMKTDRKRAATRKRP